MPQGTQDPPTSQSYKLFTSDGVQKDTMVKVPKITEGSEESIWVHFPGEDCWVRLTKAISAPNPGLN